MMWFQDINKKQFTHYALLETKLDLAYWYSELIEYIDNTLDRSDSKAVLIKEIVNLIDEVKENINSLEGIQRKLVQHHLDYIAVVCGSYIKLPNPGGMQQVRPYDNITDNDKMNIDINFIKQRSELLPMEDLLARWDRGIYILYDYLKCAESRQGHLYEIDLSKRMLAAKDLMSPTLDQIDKYCTSYANQLDLDWLRKVKVHDQYTRDCLKLFSAGYALANFCGHCQTISENLSDVGGRKHRTEWGMLEKERRIVEQAVITANMRKAKNMIKQIDLPKTS